MLQTMYLINLVLAFYGHDAQPSSREGLRKSAQPLSSTLGNQIARKVHGNIVHTKTHTESNHAG